GWSSQARTLSSARALVGASVRPTARPAASSSAAGTGTGSAKRRRPPTLRTGSNVPTTPLCPATVTGAPSARRSATGTASGGGSSNGCSRTTPRAGSTCTTATDTPAPARRSPPSSGRSASGAKSRGPQRVATRRPRSVPPASRSRVQSGVAAPAPASGGRAAESPADPGVPSAPSSGANPTAPASGSPDPEAACRQAANRTPATPATPAARATTASAKARRRVFGAPLGRLRVSTAPHSPQVRAVRSTPDQQFGQRTTVARYSPGTARRSRMYVAATLRATLAASAVLAALGGRSRAFEEDVRDARELPPDLRVLRVHIPLGTLSVESGEPGRLTFEGRSRRVAATQADLERLREVDFRPVLSPTDEPGVYEYAAPDPPETLDEAGQAAMVLKGVLRLPPDVAVDVRTFRGPLSVVDRRADVRLWTASGDLRVDGVTGDVAATTHRGNVILRGIRGSVAVETDDGAILAFIDEIGPGGLQLDSEQPA